MDTEELKSAIDKAQEAVKDVKDESLKKIAFQKALDTLLTPPQQIPQSSFSFQTPHERIPQTQTHPVSNEVLETISEFVHGKNQTSHANIVLAMAYYLHFKINEDFNADDIQKGYRTCLIPAPKNIPDIINKNIQKGLIVKSDKEKDGRQAYYITMRGIEYVRSDFTLELKFSQPKSRPKLIEKENEQRPTPETTEE